MNGLSAFPLAAPQASSVAARVDTLFYALTALCGLAATGIFIALIVFAIRYRRGSAADRSHPITTSRLIERGWTGVTLTFFLGMFAWASVVYKDIQLPPGDTLDIYIVGKQWMWKAQHPDGRREVGELHVPLGQPVKLIMTSEDVIHSFFLPAFRLKQDVVPGRYTTLWFTATELGEFPLFCAEFCGAGHSRMGGRIVVMTPADYQRWLRAGSTSTGMAAAGAERFRQYGCSGCHGDSATVHAPKLEGVFGKPVRLADGTAVVADERYIRDSVLLPTKEIVAGYPPIMPSFQGQIGEQELLEIIAYIKSLAKDERSPP